jgi:hypothetical protein
MIVFRYDQPADAEGPGNGLVARDNHRPGGHDGDAGEGVATASG